MTDRVLFVGVSTGGSSAHDVFPAWMRELGLDVTLEGFDLPLGAPRDRYRALLRGIAADPATRGAVITSHKLDVHAATRDLLRDCDPAADALGECNAIARHPDGSLTGHARDPDALAHVLPAIIGEEFAGDVVLLGAGGAGAAIAHALSRHRIIAADTRADRLRALPGVEAAADATEALARAGPGALVVNATGVGKDVPGSPLGDGARFPEGAIAWDLNYRGSLEFLAQARAQPGVTVHDGWHYFLHGWAAALSPVLGFEVTPERFARLAAAAEPARP